MPVLGVIPVNSGGVVLKVISVTVAFPVLPAASVPRITMVYIAPFTNVGKVDKLLLVPTFSSVPLRL